MKRLPLLLSLLALILLSVSIAYWVLQLYQPPQRRLAAAPLAAMPEPSVEAAATLFGGQAAATVAANYQLTGVVADGRRGVAIIVAEGTPPKALPIGKELAPGVTLQEVHPRYVMLSDNGVPKRIDLAPDTKPAATAGAPPGQPSQQPQPQPPQQQPPPAGAAQNAPPSTALPGPPAGAPVQMPAPVRNPPPPGSPTQ